MQSSSILALLGILLVPLLAQAQQEPPFEPVGPIKVSQFRPIAAVAGEEDAVVHTTDNATPDQPLATQQPPAPPGTCDPAPTNPEHRLLYSEIWGTVALPMYATGSRMAPNGVPFNPLFGLDFDFNLGILPHKELYLFMDSKFWGQKAAPGVTNPSQGQFDFSKREFDLWLGGAWNYYRSFELRVSAYGMNNLNRGDSLASPYGFKDGILIENRYYFGCDDIYDVGRLSFVSLGYYPSKSLVAGDGTEFKPGLFARAYLTYDIKPIRSYLYFDGQFTAERVASPRLLDGDFGLAARPFLRVQNVEFRLGIDLTDDVKANTKRDLVYGSVGFNF